MVERLGVIMKLRAHGQRRGVAHDVIFEHCDIIGRSSKLIYLIYGKYAKASLREILP